MTAEELDAIERTMIEADIDFFEKEERTTLHMLSKQRAMLIYLRTKLEKKGELNYRILRPEEA